MIPPSASENAAVVERLAAEMAARWKAGERPLAEEILDRCPDLWLERAAVLELVAEEITLRDEFDWPATESELALRFPRWSAEVASLLDCQRVLGPYLGPLQFPEPGERLGEFSLLAELGRGAHGRAYPATQPALAGRRVVLKLGPASGSEHLSLARLQFTHIVPLFSVHEFRGRALRGLCMPYFGGSTLADLRPRLGAASCGKDLLPAEAGDLPDRGPAREFLARAPFADAVCWVGACLADALQYAHDRGVLHLDVKPSNILIAADGTPMLLDFHLARPPLRKGDPAPQWLGGTSGYMAPELAAGMSALRSGQIIVSEIDGRADVFSLGVVLEELLAAVVPRGAVPVGLADALARTRAADPRDRYPTAAAFGDDLRRHLADLPLRGVGNRSVRERWSKWRRRRPFALPLALALGAILAVGGAVAVQMVRLADRARAARDEGLEHIARGEYDEAAQAFRSGEALAEGVPFDRPLRADLRRHRGTAERARTATDLHQFCERARPLYDAEFATHAQLRAAADRCRELWDRRESLAALLAEQPTPALERQWRSDLIDVAVLLARLEERAAEPSESVPAHRRALEILDQAESLLGTSVALDLERGRHARAAGMKLPEATLRGQSRPPATAWDHLTAGRSYLAGGDLARAESELTECLAQDPQSLWAHYYQGVCCLRLEHPVRAVAAFSASAALAPRAAWCVYNRGLAYAEAGQGGQALADFDRALALDPALAAAYLGRAAVHNRAGRQTEALADLRTAAARGVSEAETGYREALVLQSMGDRQEAIVRLRRVLQHNPSHSAARELLGRLIPAR